MGAFEPKEQELAAPIAFPPMNNRPLRLCVDQRKLNTVTVGDCSPKEVMGKGIDALGDALIFSTLDPKYSFLQAEMKDPDLDKTASTSHHGLFRLSQTPLGLATYLAHYNEQRM